MFKPADIVIDAYLEWLAKEFKRAHPDVGIAELNTLERAGRLALTHTARTNALYTNLDGCLLTTEVAMRIIEGRQIERFDVSVSDWLHFIVASLCCFTGFVRGVLPGDNGRDLVAGPDNQRFRLDRGQHDGCLYPVFVDRGQLFVHHRFHDDPLLDTDRLAEYLDSLRWFPTRKPVEDLGTYSALLGGAQMIAHAADPRFQQRMKRFYRQLKEAGEAEQMGYANADDVIATYPRRFWKYILPQIELALSYLKYTGDGQLWLARLNSHMLVEEHRT